MRKINMYRHNYEYHFDTIDIISTVTTKVLKLALGAHYNPTIRKTGFRLESMEKRIDSLRYIHFLNIPVTYFGNRRFYTYGHIKKHLLYSAKIDMVEYIIDKNNIDDYVFYSTLPVDEMPDYPKIDILFE